MLNIVCVKEGKWPDNSGLGAEYVNILANSIYRNLPEGVQQGRFVCFTDDPSGLDPLIEVRALPEELKGRGWWNKLWLFKRGHFDDGDKILFLDLDTVICGPMDAIVAYEPEKLTILEDFYRGLGTYGSSAMMWKANHYAYLWEDYKIAGYPELPGGDQTWIEQKLLRCALWQEVMPGAFVSYKRDCRYKFPKNSSVCCFHGLPRPHEVKNGWVPDFWKINGMINASITPAYCNTALQPLIDNISHSIKTGNFILEEATPAHAGHAVIVGGGPSIDDCVSDLRARAEMNQHFVSLNNSWRWLEKHDLPCHMHMMVDARPENADFLPPAGSKIERWYATQCDKSVIDPSLKEPLFLWNCMVEDLVAEFENQHRETGLPAMKWVGFGSSVGLRAIFVLYTLGYREFHIYGFDSSYKSDEAHAYKQPLNDGERTLEVIRGDKKYKCAPWMIMQAEEFLHIVSFLTQRNCVFTVHGEGLLVDMTRENLIEGKPAPDQRAESILKAIEHIKNPIGVEVGVFRGTLSAKLLAREDLTLYMVDSWIEHAPESAYAKSDFHGNLSAMRQEGFYLDAKKQTEFAKFRRTILRADSGEAARGVQDGSLDFIFLDADHTPAGIQADLAAWYPKLKPDGVFCGHDYDHPNPDWGVKAAVDDFARAHGFTVELGQDTTWFIHLNKQREKKYA